MVRVMFLAVMAFLLGISQSNAKIINLSNAENGQVIKAETGDILYIKVPANVTTGYSWQFQYDDLNVAGKIAEGYVQGEEAKMGASGDYEYILKMLKGGNITIKGYYYRLWEKLDESNDLKVEYFVKVNSVN